LWEYSQIVGVGTGQQAPPCSPSHTRERPPSSGALQDEEEPIDRLKSGGASSDDRPVAQGLDGEEGEGSHPHHRRRASINLKAEDPRLALKLPPAFDRPTGLHRQDAAGASSPEEHPHLLGIFCPRR